MNELRESGIGRTRIEIDSEFLGFVTNDQGVDQLTSGRTRRLNAEHRRQRFCTFGDGGVVELLQEDGHRLIDDFDAHDGRGGERRGSAVVGGHRQFEFRVVAVERLTQEDLAAAAIDAEQFAAAPQQLVADFAVLRHVFVDGVHLSHYNSFIHQLIHSFICLFID